MRARLLLRERRILGVDRFADLAIWQVPKPVSGSLHDFKHRLAYIVGEACVLRFNNEAGKGDHKHVGQRQAPYEFSTLDRLIEDFWRSVEEWRPE